LKEHNNGMIGGDAQWLRECFVKPQLQVHADSSNFAAGVGKKEAYEQVIEQASALFDGQRNWV
jgi:hypothetical protein